VARNQDPEEELLRLLQQGPQTTTALREKSRLRNETVRQKLDQLASQRRVVHLDGLWRLSSARRSRSRSRRP
jgi:predicted transcriptional regulator